MKFTNPSKYRGIKETWNLQIHPNAGESKKHEIYKSIQIQGNPRNMKLTNPSKYRGIQETWNLQIYPNTGESKKTWNLQIHPNTGESKKHEIYKSIQIQGNQRNMKLTNPFKYRGIKETWNLQIHPNTGESKKHET